MLGLDYEDLLPVLGKLATSTTVKALVADEELQRMLVSRAGSNDLLMRGFIGECKAIMNSSQQSPPAQSLPEPKSEILFFFLFFFKKKKKLRSSC